MPLKKSTKLPVHLTEQRERKFQELASNRQLDLTVVLENVHDPHNIGAVMRTCDAVGISKIYLIVTDIRVWDKIELGMESSSGARKWVDVFVYDNCQKCFEHLRQEYDQILGTHLSQDSFSLYDIDFAKSTALVFGNEHEGLTEEALKYLDGNFTIPQFGMVQSLNISVACAVSCYEALRQRKVAGNYNKSELSRDQIELVEKYKQQHVRKYKGNLAKIVK